MSLYNELSKERKAAQEAGTLPEWYTTPSYQILKERYLDKDETYRDRVRAIAERAASHMKGDAIVPNSAWASIFFDLIWSGKLSPSTPVLSSMGRDDHRAFPVSCSGNSISDSIEGFYSGITENAILSKHGFGTSSYMGNIRHRGANIRDSKIKASGTLPVFKAMVQMTRDVNQGGIRRGQWAGYLDIQHNDFDEIVNHYLKQPDDFNVGWVITDKFVQALQDNDLEALRRFQTVLHAKMVTGKGYFFFKDKVNRANPIWYKDKGVTVEASNLCCEIALPSSQEETFTCVLSSLNLSLWDEITDSDISKSLVFLHCVALEFIRLGENIEGMQKAIRFTKRHKALGLGALGFHTYLQSKGIPFESLDAHFKNLEIFKRISDVTENTTRKLAKVFGDCDVALGYGVANAHLTAIAPNLSSALLCGGVSQGIEPIYKNAFIQNTSAGKIIRVNPVLLKIMQERLQNVDEEVDNIITKYNGSVQFVDWLSEEEKLVFRTAFEINQNAIIRLAAARQPYITQAQSINLFFTPDTSEEEIAQVHKEAFLNENIKSLYYIRSETGLTKFKPDKECIACEG